MNVAELQPTHRIPDGVKDLRVFQISGSDWVLGVMHSRKPHLPNEEYGIHISISKSYFDKVMPVTDADVEMAKEAIVERGCGWPEQFEIVPFEAGPFRGKGKHVWEVAKNQED